MKLMVIQINPSLYICVLAEDLINVLFWNLNGFDCISVVAGEIQDPARSLPRGLLLALAAMVVTCTYSKTFHEMHTALTFSINATTDGLPLFAALIASDPAEVTKWGDDDDSECSWTCIAASLGHGRWLSFWILIVSCRRGARRLSWTRNVDSKSAKEIRNQI